MNLVVTGCPRSGTRYAAEVLSRVGIPCTHEAVYSPYPRVRPERIFAESSYLAAPYVNDLPDDVLVVHLIRDPVNVIASLLSMGFFTAESHAPYRAPVQHFCPEVFQGDELEMCNRFWVAWNRLAERKTGAYVRVHVENLTVPFDVDRNSRPVTVPITESDLSEEVKTLYEEYR